MRNINKFKFLSPNELSNFHEEAKCYTYHMPTIIFIHGLNSENTLFNSAQQFFSNKGFTFKEFALNKKHSYTDTKISVISRKLINKLNLLRKSDQEILIIGHSLGSIAPIITKDVNIISKLILWDASLNPYDVLVNTKKAIKLIFPNK